MATLKMLKDFRDFQRVYRQGRSVANRYLILYWLENDGQGRRFGFSLSKKLGKAVRRNKLRRRLKEICRLNLPWFSDNCDYVFIARKEAIDKDFHQLKESVRRLLEKCKEN